jgi:hypothetical protein
LSETIMGGFGPGDVLDDLPLLPLARDAQSEALGREARREAQPAQRWWFAFDGWRRSTDLDAEFVLA